MSSYVSQNHCSVGRWGWKNHQHLRSLLMSLIRNGNCVLEASLSGRSLESVPPSSDLLVILQDWEVLGTSLSFMISPTKHSTRFGLE